MSEKKKTEWWPIGIVMAMLTFIGGVVFAVTIMWRNEVPLTSDDYYAKEIAYQGEIEDRSRALDPAHKPEVRELRASDAVEVRFPGKALAANWVGKATFFRPSDPRLDFQADLKPDSSGVAWVRMNGKAAGLWVLQLSWSEDGQSYYYEQQIMR